MRGVNRAVMTLGNVLSAVGLALGREVNYVGTESLVKPEADSYGVGSNRLSQKGRRKRARWNNHGKK